MFYDLFCFFFAEIKNSSDCISMISAALTKLPVAHFKTLKYMIKHLFRYVSCNLSCCYLTVNLTIIINFRVTTKSDINKMTAHNLSTVFAPTLIALTTQVTNLTQEILVLELLITFCHDVFRDI